MPQSHPDQRHERGQRTRTALIEAGLELFARKGFDSVSTRELAEASRANVAAIHFHFGSKAGLYAAVVDHVAGYLSGLYRESLEPPSAPGDLSPAQALEAARAMIARLMENLLTTPRSRWTSLLLQREFIDPTEAFDRIFDHALLPALEAFARLVETAGGKPRGSLDNKALAFAIFVLASAYSRSRATFLRWSDRQGYSDQDVAGICRAVSEFILNGLTGTPDSGPAA